MRRLTECVLRLTSLCGMIFILPQWKKLVEQMNQSAESRPKFSRRLVLRLVCIRFLSLLYFTCLIDTHSEDEIVREATQYLSTLYRGKRSLATAHRDRAMHLMAAALAGHGQFLRGMLLSDMSQQQLPLPDLDLSVNIDVIHFPLVCPCSYSIGPCYTLGPV